MAGWGRKSLRRFNLRPKAMFRGRPPGTAVSQDRPPQHQRITVIIAIIATAPLTEKFEKGRSGVPGAPSIWWPAITAQLDLGRMRIGPSSSSRRHRPSRDPRTDFRRSSEKRPRSDTGVSERGHPNCPQQVSKGAGFGFSPTRPRR
jgi:hypothetical protein